MKKYTFIITAALVILLVYPAYRTFQWWEKYQKKKQLFLYFQKESPLTKKVPEDAVFYANLYDLRRVHSDIQETYFARVLEHWLDTGMSKNQKVNRMRGGMLEKTILNLLGQEFILAGLPSREGLDLLAMARLAPGSDFLLKLGLASRNRMLQIEQDNRTFHLIETRSSRMPQVFVFIENDVAYACTSLKRLADAIQNDGNGPAFLQRLHVQPIPEDTVLFFRVAEPNLELELSGSKKRYRLTARTSGVLNGPLPTFKPAIHEILSIHTNIAVILGLPAAAYVLRNEKDRPVSSLHLAFSDPKMVRRHRKEIVQRLSSKESDTVRVIRKNGVHCYTWKLTTQERFLCSRGLSIVTTDAPYEPERSDFLTAPSANEKHRVVLKPSLHSDRLESFRDKVQRSDWSEFGSAGEFYFLSCLKEIRGAIEGASDTIELEIR